MIIPATTKITISTCIQTQNGDMSGALQASVDRLDRRVELRRDAARGGQQPLLGGDQPPRVAGLQRLALRTDQPAVAVDLADEALVQRGDASRRLDRAQLADDASD